MKSALDFEKGRIRLAASLRLFRVEHQYTQQNLAEWLCIKRCVYSSYEMGRNLPNIFLLDRIAALYGLSIDDILHNPDVEYLFSEK